MKIEPLSRVAIANIDFPFAMEDNDGNRTHDGFLTTSFENVKKTIDRARTLGFDAIALECNVPIDIKTGGLQIKTPDGNYNRDKSFSPEIWKIIAYAESLGMKTVIDFQIRDAITDNTIYKSSIGPNFDVKQFFKSIKTFEIDVAKQAQLHGVDSIRIGSMNFGFSDDVKYKSDWQDIVSSMREVYQGQLGYQDTFWAKGQNVVWDLVDNVVVTFAPNLSRTHEYEVENLLSKYFITQNQVSEPNIWLKNPNAELMELIEQYKGKNIILNDIWFQPGQPGAGRFLNIGSYIWGENSTAEWGNTEMRVFPNEKIDHRSMQTQLKAFFEYFGNYLADKVAGFEYYQYAPWADAKQFKFPSNHNSLAYQSVIKAMGLLNYTPEAEEIISRYISREWGFRTLHYGTDRSDQLAGSEADDKFFDSLGSDTMDGGVGLDTVRFTGNLVNYSIDTTANSVLIQKPGNGQDHLANVERLLFDDRAVALDTDRTAGKSYRIYKAAFNRTPDTGGLGYWIAQMDKGMDVVSVAARFIDSPEFRSLYGQNPTNAEFLTKVYSNVLARTPDAAGLDWWVNEMKTNPTKTWQKVLADFSESTENQANVASLIANGIEYAPWTG